MLVHSVFRTLRRYAMVRPGDHLLVALSGGPDSVALAQALFDLRPRLPLDLTLAHLNHQLRHGADEDEAFCEAFAQQLDLPFVSERVDVKLEARRARCSIEESARAVRYRFLEEQASRLGCQHIAVGHTRDDQAETFLLRLLRGAGATGLAAIPPIRGPIIRPLLDVPRSEVLAFLSEKGLAYREDPTNADLDILRNRIRHQVLPDLARDFNGRLVETLATTAGLLREEDRYLDERATDWLASHAQASPDKLRIPVAHLAALHPALSRRVLRQALLRLKGDLRSVAARHLEAALQLLAPGKSGRRLALPGGVEAVRSFAELAFCLSSPPVAGAGFRRPVPVPGEVEVPEASGLLRVEESNGPPLPRASGDSVVIQLGSGTGRLAIRSPRRGDRFHPLGAPGRKRLSRYLMERLVPRDERGRIPLLVAEEADSILWVVGHSVSEGTRVQSASRQVLRLDWLAAEVSPARERRLDCPEGA